MGKVTINGRSFNVSDGASISVIDGTVMVNGDVITTGVKADQIVVNGNFLDLKTSLSVNVNGTIKGNVEAGGSVNCDAIGGNVEAGGSVNCDDVGGNVTAGGSVKCDDVMGRVIK